MRVAIDTNRYTDFMRGIPEAVATFRSADHLAVPLVVLAELRAGFLSGTMARENERTLGRFLGRGRVRVLYPEDATTHLYARVLSELRRKGSPIPTNDLWIAALAMQHDLPLYTRDRHFERIEGLATL